MTATAHSPDDPNTEELTRRFADAMGRLGPFEANPHLAVAVSGGADSTALVLLAHDWARRRGGEVTALVVDHGLRAASAAEATEVAARLGAFGISARVLRWTGAKPTSAVQAAARTARYGLLRSWCRDAGVLHLLTGHHADDQAETYLMRRARGGVRGHAGMSALLELPEVRLVRPLLAFQRAELTAYLAMLGVAWTDDPSNADEAFERVRMRRRLAADPALAEAARSEILPTGKARAALEAAVNGALAETVSLHPLGFAFVHRAAFRRLPDDVAAVLAGRLAQVLGGAEHAPPGARAERLSRRLARSGDFPGASLGRCRFLAERAGRVAVCRDRRGLPAPGPAVPGRIAEWDGRFMIDLPADLPQGLILAPFGADGWRRVPRDLRRASGLTLAFAATLPALFRDGSLAAHALSGQGGLTLRFRPKNSLGFNGFCIA